MSRPTLLTAGLLVALGLAVFAAQAAERGASVPPAEPAEPQVKWTVIEDDGARIEELRVRGQTQKVTVQPKNAPAYEIIMADGSRDLSAGAGSNRGAAGTRVWRVLDF
jgi:hypothetical protein